MRSLFLIALFIVITICMGRITKNLGSAKSGWQKLSSKLTGRGLILETYLISFAFYIAIHLFGLFPCKIFGANTANIWARELLLVLCLFVILPLLFFFFFVIVLSNILTCFHYRPEIKRSLRIIFYYLGNKIYFITVFVVILHEIFKF